MNLFFGGSDFGELSQPSAFERVLARRRLEKKIIQRLDTLLRIRAQQFDDTQLINELTSLMEQLNGTR